MANVQTNESQFLKTLKFYVKMNRYLKSMTDISLLKSNKVKGFSVQVLSLIFYTYLLLNPIRLVVSLVEMEPMEMHEMFLYMYIIFFRMFHSLCPLIKLFRKCRHKELIEKFAEHKTENEENLWYNKSIIYKSVYILLCVIVIGAIIIDLVIPLWNKDLLTYLKYPVPADYKFIIPFLAMQAVFNSLAAFSIFIDIYINLLIAVTLTYHFNKVANEAQSYVTEKQSAKPDSIKNHREITDICNTHDTLSSILRLVNESLKIVSASNVLGSIISCCFVTYGIINNVVKNNMYTNIYVAMMVLGCALTWIAIFWCGIYLNSAVSSINSIQFA